MNILFLAPHPFYQDRGTSIAVDLMLRVLSERKESVDVITYHEGSDVHYDGMTWHRIPRIPFIHDVRPGFSFLKLICDGFMTVRVLQQLLKKRYHVIHSRSIDQHRLSLSNRFSGQGILNLQSFFDFAKLGIPFLKHSFFYRCGNEYLP